MARPVVRRPRRGGPAGPGARAGVRAGAPPHHSTSTPPRRSSAVVAAPLTEAQILVGTASWLVGLRDWLAESIDLAEGRTVALRREDAETMRDGLTRCTGLLDALSIDPAQLPPLEDAPPDAEPSPAAPTTRVLQ